MRLDSYGQCMKNKCDVQDSSMNKKDRNLMDAPRAEHVRSLFA